jgi:hypothetical protein
MRPNDLYNKDLDEPERPLRIGWLHVLSWMDIDEIPIMVQPHAIPIVSGWQMAHAFGCF